MPLAVNGNRYRRTVCGRLVDLGLRDGIIKIRHKLAHFRKSGSAFMLQNQRFFLVHGERFRFGGFRSGRVMLRFRNVKRLDFYVVGQMRFLGRIERHGFGDGLLLFRYFRSKQMGVALVPAQQRGKPFLAFYTKDGICLRRVAEMHVKKPDFGNLKGLVVQIDGIVHRIGEIAFLR